MVEELDIEAAVAVGIVAVEGLGTAAVVEVDTGTVVAGGLGKDLMEDKLAFDWVHCTKVEHHRTSCTQVAAPAVAVEHQKSFGKTADQMDRSTMDYTWSARIAGSSSNLDTTPESGSLGNKKNMTLV